MTADDRGLADEDNILAELARGGESRSEDPQQE
jgi:hypothetical protein